MILGARVTVHGRVFCLIIFLFLVCQFRKYTLVTGVTLVQLKLSAVPARVCRRIGCPLSQRLTTLTRTCPQPLPTALETLCTLNPNIQVITRHPKCPLQLIHPIT
jgi:hypothetical protein